MSETQHAVAQAESQLCSIKEMVAELERLEPSGGRPYEEAIQRIYEDPLSVEVRSGWVSVSDYPGPAGEFLVLLSTGGPATRLIGELDTFSPVSVRLEYQDWGIPWTDYPLSPEDEAVVLQYCQQIWFGEGL